MTRSFVQKPPRIDVGQIIAERYELARPLGRGSMGEVWVAHHRTLGEDVALKLLTQAPPETEIEHPSTAVARFRFEAQVAARLSRRTRHIVRVTDNGEEDGLAYLVMELLEGETLATRLLRSGPLDLAATSQLIAQIARALTEAHAAGVMHRDLKPANVFLTRNEEGALLVKLLDFGIARTIQSHRLEAPFATAPGLVFGTPGYMSPEQVFSASEVDHRCDLWALATIAYEALTAELPMDGTQTQELLAALCAGRIVPVHERDPGLPALLAGFFARAFAQNVADRFADATELSGAFEGATCSEASATSDRAAAAPSALQGSTRPLTLPMRRRLPGDAGSSPRTARRARFRLFVASAALLVGGAALGTGWRALALRGPRAEAAPAGSATAEASGALENGATPPQPSPPEESVLPAPVAQAAIESANVAHPASIQRSPRPAPRVTSNVDAVRAAPLKDAAPTGPCSSSCAPSPPPTRVPASPSGERVPADPSEVL